MVTDNLPCFLGLSEDVIIQICSFLSPLDLCRLSVCCRRLYNIGNLNVVWLNACRFHILANGYPFRSRQLSSDESASVDDLRSRVLDAYLLAKRWQTGMTAPRNSYSISGALGTSVSDIRFLPDNKLFIAVSKTIWSTLSIWRMQGDILDEATMVADWSPRGVIVTSLVVNEKEGSDGSVAISALLEGMSTVRIFNIAKRSDFTFDLREVYCLNTFMEPITLSGNILVLADTATQTVVRNWKDGTRAILRIPPDDLSSRRSNQCLQTLFSHESVLVVRAHAVYLFPNPILMHSEDPTSVVYDAIARYSFGWVDGISAVICPYLATTTTTASSSTHSSGSALWPPISILVRGQSDDPWARDTHYLELATLFPNPEYVYNPQPTCGDPTLPYIFPPQKSYQVKCRRGVLRCRRLRLGKYGTAVWLAPRERYSMGLVTGFLSPVSDSDEDQWRWKDQNTGPQQNESLRVGVFPGSLSCDRSQPEVSVTNLVENEAHNWTCFDYDEVGGRIIVASSFGQILVVGL